jgi:hypothetical protein
MMYRPWSRSLTVGAIYRYPGPSVGQKNSIPKGTLVLCAAHTGDNHYRLLPLRATAKGTKFAPRLTAQFHDYGWRRDKGICELSDRNYHLLMAGETITIPSMLREAL